MILVENKKDQTLNVSFYKIPQTGFKFIIYSKTTNRKTALEFTYEIFSTYLQISADFTDVAKGEYDYLITSSDEKTYYGHGLLEVRVNVNNQVSYSPDTERNIPTDVEEKVTLTLSSDHASFIGEGTYSKGITKEIICIPDEGYSFSKWSDGDTSADRYVTLSDNLTLSVELIDVTKLEEEKKELEDEVEFMEQTEELDITENGTYEPSTGKYAIKKVTVDIAGGALQEKDIIIDENGIAFSETLDVTENGTYNGIYDRVNVNVDQHETEIQELEDEVAEKQATIESQSATISEQKNTIESQSETIESQEEEIKAKSNVGEITITANGTYNPSTDGKYAYSKVIVNEDTSDNLAKYMDGSISYEDDTSNFYYTIDLSAYPVLKNIKFGSTYLSSLGRNAYQYNNKFIFNPNLTTLDKDVFEYAFIGRMENEEQLKTIYGMLYLEQINDETEIYLRDIEEMYLQDLYARNMTLGENLRKCEIAYYFYVYGNLTILAPEFDSFTYTYVDYNNNTKIYLHRWFDGVDTYFSNFNNAGKVYYLEDSATAEFSGTTPITATGDFESVVEVPLRWTYKENGSDEEKTKDITYHKKYYVNTKIDTSSEESSVYERKNVDIKVCDFEMNDTPVDFKYYKVKGSEFDLYLEFVYSSSYSNTYTFSTSIFESITLDGEELEPSGGNFRFTFSAETSEHTIGYKLVDGVTSGAETAFFGSNSIIGRKYIYYGKSLTDNEYIWFQNDSNKGYKCELVINCTEFGTVFETQFIGKVVVLASNKGVGASHFFNGSTIPLIIMKEDNSEYDDLIESEAGYSERGEVIMTQTQYDRIKDSSSEIPKYCHVFDITL